MKKLFVPCGVVALALAGPAFAQNADAAPKAAPAAATAPASATAPSAPAAPSASAATTAPVAPAASGLAAASPVGQFIERMVSQLKLSPEQSAQVAAMRQKFEAATEGLRADLRARFMALRQMRSSGQVDPVQFEAKRKELTAVQDQLRAELDKLTAEIDTVLDAGQREQFDRLRADMIHATEAPSTRPAPTAAPPAGGASPR